MCKCFSGLSPWFLTLFLCGFSITAFAGDVHELSAETLRDKIRGGLLGQMLGNLNGLPHENRYFEEPGNVTDYVPSLPEGARTDDDTDLEWVYIMEMQRQNEILLSPEIITKLWKERINRRIWCSNQYARQLMDLGLQPPFTGQIALNPWAEFNISGQFLCETFGLLAPGMPQTAAHIGLNYTQVGIDHEPAQTTQLFTTMIAAAFVEEDIDALLDAGQAAVDPNSRIYEIVDSVRAWHQEHPTDWRITREEIRNKYTLYKEERNFRDFNGYELNTASTVAALLYGHGDFVRTLTMAFNFGWDADNNAATSGTIVGVLKGYRWMLAQGWQVVDRYRNTTRQEMPENETITSFADRLIDLAERVIINNGGSRQWEDGRIVFRIQTEQPANIRPLTSLKEQVEQAGKELEEEIRAALLKDSSREEKARATYLAICLDRAQEFQREQPEQWKQGIAALESYPNVLQVLFHHSPVPAAEPLREKTIRVGITPPKEKQPLWE